MRLNGILAELKNRPEPGQGGTTSAAAPRMGAICMRAGGIGICLCCAHLLCSFLHELGHCIAVWVCGGTVTGFYPFGPNPHMTYEGVVESISLALVHVAGAMLPLMTIAAVLLLYRGSEKHFLLNISMVIMSVIFLFTVVPWVVEPLCYLFDLAAPGDDVIKFIDTTGFHPAACIWKRAAILFLFIC